MLSRAYLIGMVAALLVYPGALVAEDTLETAEMALKIQWAKQKSISAKITMKMESQRGEDKRSLKGEGTYEFMRKDDRVLFRQEMTAQSVQVRGGQESKVEHTYLTISDGEFLYDIRTQWGQTKAAKSKLEDAAMGTGPAAVFKEMQTMFEVKQLRDDKLDGKEVYVIETVPKRAPSTSIGKTLFYFRKDIGMMVKRAALDAEGKETMTMIYSDIKVNEAIDPKRFVFKAPEGVEVIDRTGK